MTKETKRHNFSAHKTRVAFTCQWGRRWQVMGMRFIHGWRSRVKVAIESNRLYLAVICKARLKSAIVDGYCFSGCYLVCTSTDSYANPLLLHNLFNGTSVDMEILSSAEHLQEMNSRFPIWMTNALCNRMCPTPKLHQHANHND